MFSKYTVKLAPALYERACTLAEKDGYSSVDEFVTHAVERALALAEEAEAKEAVVKQLKGLGYLE